MASTQLGLLTYRPPTLRYDFKDVEFLAIRNQALTNWLIRRGSIMGKALLKRYTTTELAELAGIGPQVVLRYRAEGIITHCDKGQHGTYIFDEVALKVLKGLKDKEKVEPTTKGVARPKYHDTIQPTALLVEWNSLDEPHREVLKIILKQSWVTFKIPNLFDLVDKSSSAVRNYVYKLMQAKWLVRLGNGWYRLSDVALARLSAIMETA